MEEKVPITAPTLGESVSMSLTRVGKILFNYSIVIVLLCVIGYAAAALMALADVAWTFVALLLLLFTFGTILAVYPDIFDGAGGGIEAAKELSALLSKVIPIIAGVGIAVCVAAAVLLFTQKRERCTVRFVISIIFAAILTAIMFLVLFTGGDAA